MAKDKLEQLYTNYASDMLQWAKTFFPEKADREDAVSEAFLKIMPHADRVKDTNGFAAKRFCYVILRNVCLNMLRKKKREIPTDFSHEQAGSILETQRHSSGKTSDGNYETLYAALKELPDETVEILWLHYDYGYSAREISKQYNKSEWAIHQILSRSRKRLRTILEGNNNHEKEDI